MYITAEQFEDLEDALQYGRREDFNLLLEEYTGITAKPYTAFQYFDCVGNYVADSEDYTVRELLECADIEVRGECE